ncbi:hypothetical protein ABIE54_002329 [Chitinophagaceae bacterium OAS944]
MVNYFKRSFAVFSLLGFLFIPLTFLEFDFQYQITKFIFYSPVAFIQNQFFPNAIKNIEFSSDTIGLNILLGLLLIISLLLVVGLQFFRLSTERIIPLFKLLSAYYVAIVFLKYGFDKIFKRQFYLPEPNILYSNFGSLTRDTLFWSTMGTSHIYSIVTGAIEVLAGALILFKRTRIAGFFLALIVSINILLINISFDISVKLFTSFLLMVVFFNLYAVLKTTYVFFIQHKAVQLPASVHNDIPVNKRVHAGLCAVIVGLVLTPAISTRNFNDDNTQRPLLHGAYQIEHFTVNNDSLNRNDFPYRRFFIHRNDYIIFQKEDETMVDYFFEINEGAKQMTITDYENNKISVTYNYNAKEGDLQLSFGNKAHWTIQSKALNWKALPALQDGMHYTIDEIK